MRFFPATSKTKRPPASPPLSLPLNKHVINTHVHARTHADAHTGTHRLLPLELLKAVYQDRETSPHSPNNKTVRKETFRSLISGAPGACPHREGGAGQRVDGGKGGGRRRQVDGESHRDGGRRRDGRSCCCLSSSGETEEREREGGRERGGGDNQVERREEREGVRGLNFSGARSYSGGFLTGRIIVNTSGCFIVSYVMTHVTD